LLDVRKLGDVSSGGDVCFGNHARGARSPLHVRVLEGLLLVLFCWPNKR
jgi:hypothetical protein